MIVNGNVTRLSTTDTPSQTSPRRVRGARMDTNDGRHPLHPGRERPQQPAEARTR